MCHECLLDMRETTMLLNNFTEEYRREHLNRMSEAEAERATDYLVQLAINELAEVKKKLRFALSFWYTAIIHNTKHQEKSRS